MVTGSLALLFSFASGFFWAPDPYYEMNAMNLNTMNSYFIPSADLSQGDNLAQYSDSANSYNPSYVLNKQDFFGTGIHLHIMSSYVGIILEILIILLIVWFIYARRNSGFAILFVGLFEGIYDFFEDILGKESKTWIKKYVVILFFIILISNLMGIFNDIVRFFFPRWLRNVTSPTAELEFNVALALISVVVSLVVQCRNLGFLKFIHEYIPITGKGLIEGKGFGSKLGDIIISLFIGILDIVGTFAKIISLSMRLFGNMSSGSILLNVAYLGLGGLFVGLISVNLPIGVPIIIYVQGLLVAFVQAFVFALLNAIFLKMASE